MTASYQRARAKSTIRIEAQTPSKAMPGPSPKAPQTPKRIKILEMFTGTSEKSLDFRYIIQAHNRFGIEATPPADHSRGRSAPGPPETIWVAW